MIPIIKLTYEGRPFYVNVDAIAYFRPSQNEQSTYKTWISFNGKEEDECGVDQPFEEVYKAVMAEE